MTIREMQAYSAILVNEFCRYHDININEINALITHLKSILTTEDLLLWDREGVKIDVVGRGEPIPIVVLNQIPNERLADLTKLIDFSVEIGIVDLYGERTALPYHFLDKCRSILIANNIPIPDISFFHFEDDRKLNDGWGRCYSKEEFLRFNRFYSIG